MVGEVGLRRKDQLLARCLHHERLRVATLHLPFHFLQHGRLRGEGNAAEWTGPRKNKQRKISAGERGITSAVNKSFQYKSQNKMLLSIHILVIVKVQLLFNNAPINVYEKQKRKGERKVYSSELLFPSPLVGSMFGSVLRRLILFFFSIVACGLSQILY